MNADAEFKPVPTRASLALKKNNIGQEFQALVFQDLRTPSNQLSNKAVAERPQNQKFDSACGSKSKLEEFDIKKARHEILRFAMNNQRSSKNKKKMETFQLVKLGGKAPKKPYKNYKDLLDERKRLKQIREKRKEFHQLGKNQTGAASVKCRSKTKLEKQKKKRAPVTGIDQHYGVVKSNSKKR